MYTVASHVVYSKEDKETPGPASGIYDFLKAKNKNPCFIKHDLNGLKKTEILRWDSVNWKGEYFNKNIILCSLEKVFLNIRNTESGDIYIGADPLNGFSGVVMKIFKKIDKFIYLSPDYSEKRYENVLIDKIYHIIDRICLKFTDESWSVSSRIVKKRKEQGLPDFKNKLLPNSPDFYSIERKEYDGNRNFVIISPLSETLDFYSVVKIIKNIIDKYPEVKLNVVGSGVKEDEFKETVRENNLEENIIFLGWKNHEEVIEILVDSFIGFALYTDKSSWNRYGDSMKAREYVACGVPVIISDIPSTADDVDEYEAGFVVGELDEGEVEKVTSFIDKCISDNNYYLKIRENALKMGRDFDKGKILSELLGV